MALNPFLGNSAALAEIPVELQPQFQQANTQQKMADLLMQQGLQGQPQGQMVSGHYVKPSWAQQLAPIANQALALYAGYQADKGQTDLAAALRQRKAQDVQDYMQAMSPVAAKEGGIVGPNGQMTTQTTADMYGPNMELNPQYKQVAAVEGRGPDFAKAFQVAYNSYDPALRAQALDMIKSETLPEGATKGRMNLATGKWEAFAQGGEKVSPEIRTAAQMLGVKGTPDTWSQQQTQAVANQVLSNKRAGATNVSVNTANKFAGGFADKASAGAYNMYEQALGAPQAIENSKRTIELVNKGAFTGPTANVALQAAKLFNVVGADNADTIAKTELLAANRGKALLNSAKSSGLAGSQGLTEGERKFLADAEGGRITLNGDTLKAMAGLEIKLAVQNQKRWNQQASKMDPEILRVTGAGPVDVYTGIGTVDQSVVDKF